MIQGLNWLLYKDNKKALFKDPPAIARTGLIIHGDP